MAEIRKIVPRPALSDFSRVAPSGGMAFKVLADAADAAYERFLPAAKEKLKAEGAAAGREMARRQIGDPSTYAGGGSPFRAALRTSESGGNSSVVNSEGYGGLYQWGPERLADYNRATGQNITFQQFLGNADLQERAQDWHEGDILGQLGGYVGRTVNGIVLDEGAIIGMAHLGGVGGAKKFIESGGTYDPADSNGTSLSDYARKFSGLAVGAAEPTVVQKADGTKEPRLYSPLSGELLQVHNAAAGVAYASEAMLKGATDLLAISNDFELNPDGFRQAADAYINQMVESAPEPFREDLRSELTDQAQSRFLGMVEDRQKDVRERAANSSAALAERWADNLSEALAGGNPVSAGRAEAKLRNILAARETLPGLAWTADDSENVIIKARRKAEETVQKRQKAESDGWKGTLNTIIEAAKNGLTAADEALLNDPRVQAEHPELVREALAQTGFRDALPSFNAAPKAERDAAVAELKANPIDAKYQVDIVKAAEAANKAVTDAFEADPIKAAQDYLPQKPPPLPDMTNPDAAVAAFAARAAYARGLVADGHAGYLSPLSKDEAKALGAAMGKDVPPELKAALAGAIVAGFGDDAAKVFDQIKTDDPVTKYGGMLLARGGSQEAVVAAFQGQALIDEGLVQVPNKASIASISPGLAKALSVLPNAQRIEGDLVRFATAIYANDARGLDQSDKAATDKAMASAVNKALGQSTDPRGRLTGGVQKVAGNDVLLPVGVAGEVVEERLKSSFVHGGQYRFWRDDLYVVDPNVWGPAGVGASAGSVPMIGGQPMTRRFFNDGEVVMIPVTSSTYRMEVRRPGGGVLYPTDAQGNFYLFDIKRLAE